LSIVYRANVKISSGPTDTTRSAPNETQGQFFKEAQSSPIAPVKAPSNLNGEEGGLIKQDNSDSTITKSSITKPKLGSQVDVLA
tara:strand:+ start:229 stop:480 length:252 start_codon:yes stop_codon:yes gene_type:complete